MINSSFGVITQHVAFVGRRFGTPFRFHLLGRWLWWDAVGLSLLRESVGGKLVVMGEVKGRGERTAAMGESCSELQFVITCFFDNCYFYVFLGVRGGADSWDTVLQAETSQARFPMVTLELFIDLILLEALWPWGRFSLQQKWVSGIFVAGKDGRCVGLTTLPPSCADCLQILGAWTSWSPKRLSRPVQGKLCLFCVFVCSRSPAGTEMSWFIIVLDGLSHLGMCQD